jgi:ligand-binding sensor domain-containing protein
VASLFTEQDYWVVQEGMLRTLDGSTQIVPDIACALSGATEHDGRLFIGSQGEGVWALMDGALMPVSPPWHVTALVSTDFGLFAATDEGLFTYRDDRWHRRRLSDSSTALALPAALYYRYPYLYVGTECELVRFDGGGWERFVIPEEVTALGWHNARLYVGSAEGFLYTLEGTVLEEVPSPAAGTVRALLRFDGRLHVGTDDGLYRYRHARFEKIAGARPTESEPETEPIASLL